MNAFEWKVKTIIDIFLSVSGTEQADMWHLPYEGGALEQPYKTMRMWMLMRSILAEHIAKENEKKMKDMKSKSKRR